MADVATQDFKVKDISLAPWGARKSAWPKLKCPA